MNLTKSLRINLLGIFVLSLLVLILQPGCCVSRPAQAAPRARMDRSRLNIGAYTLRETSRTE